MAAVRSQKVVVNNNSEGGNRRISSNWSQNIHNFGLSLNQVTSPFRVIDYFCVYLWWQDVVFVPGVTRGSSIITNEIVLFLVAKNPPEYVKFRPAASRRTIFYGSS